MEGCVDISFQLLVFQGCITYPEKNIRILSLEALMYMRGLNQ